MKTSRRTTLWMLGAAACVPCMEVLAAGKGTYFTTANIWYEHPEKIYSTNYHAGRIIPAGTEVEVLSAKKNRVKFRVKGKEANYLFTFVKKHSSLGFEEEFSRLFSAKNSFAEALKKFTKAEKEAVEEGKVVEGMGREAVLAAYGYPPSHMTPDLDDDHWIYWVKRMSKKEISFKKGKVSLIK